MPCGDSEMILLCVSCSRPVPLCKAALVILQPIPTILHISIL
jgi:hypothetical protein